MLPGLFFIPLPGKKTGTNNRIAAAATIAACAAQGADPAA